MKRLALCLICLVAFADSFGTSAYALGNILVAFSTLGDPPQYNSTTGIGVQGANATTITPYTGQANQFTAAFGGTLSSIEIGITFPFWAANKEVDIRLALDVNDFLPPPTELTGGTVAAQGDFATGQNSVLTVFTPANQVPIVAGQKYWLVLLPHTDTTSVNWNLNTAGAVGRIAETVNNDNSWGQNPSGTLGAFRVNVSPVPEPSAQVMCAAGCLLLATSRVRHARSRNLASSNVRRLRRRI